MWRNAVGMATCALMIGAMMLAAGAHVSAQQADSTPEDAGPQSDVTPTPVVGSTSGQLQSQPAATAEATEALPSAPTGPVASASQNDFDPPVLAQGLIYLNGGNVIWQVREVTLSGPDTVSGSARVVLQRSGVSIIRTDTTGKRIRLEPGEAFFAAADDAYTTIPEGNDASTVWIFEVSNSNQVGEGAFYLSPDVAGYGEGTYDFEFTRYIVREGETAEFPGGSGPSLLVVVSGTAEVTLDSEVAALSTQDGLVVDGAGVIGAPSGDAVVMAITIGPAVTDDSAVVQVPIASGAPTADSGDAEVAQPAVPAPSSGEGGAFVTSIKVGASEGIAVTVYADGQVAFDGWLEAGQWTEFITGSEFEVYTSNGAHTMFQNTCSTEPFWMDQTAGETSYVLTAGPSSCAPA